VDLNSAELEARFMPSSRRTLTVRLILCVTLSVTAGLTSESGSTGRAAGSWETAGILSAPHEGASATLLADGRVLIVGGEDATGALAAAEIVDVAMNVFSVPPMRTARTGHTSTLLADGCVLVTGGRDEDGTALGSAEIFDPVAGSWSDVPGGMTEARSNHVALSLQDGTVLVAGGSNGLYVIDSLEIYDPVSSLFSSLGPRLLSPRQGMAASLMADGRVFFVGGSDDQGALDTSELLDPKTGLIERGPSLSSPRTGHALVRLLDGRLLAAGGSDGQDDLSSVEIYDPQPGSFSPASSRLAAAREGYLALLLPDNNAVLFVGGRAAGKAVTTAEIYEPWNDRFRGAGSAGTGGGRVAGTLLARPGSVLVAGGDVRTAISLYHYPTILAGQPQNLPGEPLTITGSGWKPGEAINIVVEDTASGQEARTRVKADDDGELLVKGPSLPVTGAGSFSYLVTASGLNEEAQTSVLLASPTRIKVNSMSPSSGACGSTILVSATLETKIGGGAFVPLPSETVDFTLGSATGSGVTDANGVATATLVVPQGATSLDAAYAGNVTYNPTSQTIPFTVTGSCCAGLSVNAQPSGATMVYGEPASFSVTVTGTAPIAYQWRKDGSDIPSANADSYVIPSVQMTDTGSYDVVVTDACATVTSNTAALVVNRASPSLTVTSSSNPSVYGDSVTFTASAGISPPGAGAATGTIQFQIDGSDVGTPVAISSGTASSAPISALTAGLHVVTAVYSGDSNVLPGSASASPDQTVDPAPLTVTASDASRAYGSANPTLAGSLAGVQNGDNITATYASAATPASPVGGYAIVPTLIDPDGKLPNYSVTSGNGTLTVTAAPLTVTASDASRAYGSANPSLAGSLAGVQNGDNITATYASAATPASPVGGYAIVPTLIDPDGKLPNYSVTSGNGTLTVTAAPLSVTASDASRPFGLPNPAFSGSITGVQNGDNITATYASAATPASPVGTYPIVPTLVDPDARLSNYSTSVINGTLSVVPAGFMIIDPLAGAALDCSAGATPPTISWTTGAFDKFRVYISWLSSFSKRVTSGDKLLRTTSWTLTPKSWNAVCSRATTTIYIKILGVDVNVPKSNPNRKAFTNQSTGVQK
jgi:hypothetical protein